MEFRLLGPVEILWQGRNIMPTAPKPRQVISLLMLRHNTVVQASELIDELWPERPPPSAVTTLQTYIYKFRKLLLKQGLGNLLQTQPGGYSLTVPASSLDVSRFEEQAEEGQELLQQGDCAGALASFERALALWRGPALADVETGGRLFSYVTRLEELRFRILELRIEADLETGRHRELISELKSLVLAHPLHEHLHGLLMLALHRSGRRHEALEVYQSLRQKMIDELGLEPGKELARLQHTLLSDSPAELPEPPRRPRLGPAPSSAAPPGPAAAAPVPAAGAPSPPGPAVSLPPGSGPPAGRQAPPVPGSVLPPVPVPVRELLGTPAQLPAGLAGWVGRHDVLKELESALCEPDGPGADGTAARISVVTGAPGIGKSTVAVRLAHMLRPRFTDGQLYADLRGSSPEPSDPTGVLRGFLRALEVPASRIPESVEECGALFRSHTSGRRMLVLLDDVASSAQIRHLLPADPRCALLITSRRRMTALVEAECIELCPPPPEEALEILAVLAGRRRVEREPEAAHRIVELLGRHPLALRCVGGRLAAGPHLSLTALADRLGAAPRILDAARLGELDVRSRFDASYAGLTHAEQGVFRLLSMMGEAPFSAAQAAELLSRPVPEAEAVLEVLADNHLLATDRCSDSVGRYVFDRLTRAYAKERLEETLAPQQVDEEGGPVGPRRRSAGVETFSTGDRQTRRHASAATGRTDTTRRG
ncbi:winged helix-turn-helix domain-containing protein [Streptomyces sp. C10-9-1]|uniref:AfsR/SARP family transcriptional regulator n=1 Tax=Streptomyces sp. C10-9-1 TaxID=1859285 RepID=UPI002111919E|nr:AfsR/SARP family transcriptional regulator [Streptomyces sp. C10-9-1]MCQ6556731.1 winged helix-turn-helix domain-containing protein [Streptomyces sp. C10-9-1]